VDGVRERVAVATPDAAGDGDTEAEGDTERDIEALLENDTTLDDVKDNDVEALKLRERVFVSETVPEEERDGEKNVLALFACVDEMHMEADEHGERLGDTLNFPVTDCDEDTLGEPLGVSASEGESAADPVTAFDGRRSEGDADAQMLMLIVGVLLPQSVDEVDGENESLDAGDADFERATEGDKLGEGVMETETVSDTDTVGEIDTQWLELCVRQLVLDTETDEERLASVDGEELMPEVTVTSGEEDIDWDADEHGEMVEEALF
jgi:hypothetical protein